MILEEKENWQMFVIQARTSYGGVWAEVPRNSAIFPGLRNHRTKRQSIDVRVRSMLGSKTKAKIEERQCKVSQLSS